MIYASVCSGIEAASVAFEPLGWQPLWFAEIDKAPSRVLAYRYPFVPNLKDMTRLNEHEYYRDKNFDLLVGGTPCQSFSLAGLRHGLDSANGNLALQYCRILIEKRPRWFVWENVPGVFSSNSGQDFATIIAAFRECGYSIAYRVLDSQNFGVPQRRRRVFVVGYFGNDWRPPAAVLFERENLRRDFTPGRAKRQRVTGDVTYSIKDDDETASTMKRRDYKDSTDLVVTTYCGSQITSPTNRSRPKENDPCHTLSRGAAHNVILVQSFGAYDDETASTMKRRDYKNATDLVVQPIILDDQGGRIMNVNVNLSGTLRAQTHGNNPIVFNPPYVVRRLTPLECERLQGFPDNWTNVPGMSDSTRYQCCGNSMTVNVMNWIGKRIDATDKIINMLKIMNGDPHK